MINVTVNDNDGLVLRMAELDVINESLSTMGEAPIVEMDERNPMVPIIRNTLRLENQTVQSVGWWFNTEEIELHPDTSKFIYYPNDAIRCSPKMRHSIGGSGSLLDNSLAITQRGRRMYDTDRNSFEFDGSITCDLIRMLKFEDLPSLAQRVVSVSTALKFQQNYDADPTRTKQIQIEYLNLIAALRAEHTRNIRPNLLARNSTMRVLNKIRQDNWF